MNNLKIKSDHSKNKILDSLNYL